MFQAQLPSYVMPQLKSAIKQQFLIQHQTIPKFVMFAGMVAFQLFKVTFALLIQNIHLVIYVIMVKPFVKGINGIWSDKLCSCQFS